MEKKKRMRGLKKGSNCNWNFGWCVWNTVYFLVYRTVSLTQPMPTYLDARVRILFYFVRFETSSNRRLIPRVPALYMR